MIVWWENARLLRPNRQAGPYVVFASRGVLVTASCKCTRAWAHICAEGAIIHMQHLGANWLRYASMEHNCSVKKNDHNRAGTVFTSHVVLSQCCAWEGILNVKYSKPASQESNSLWMVCAYTPGVCGQYYEPLIAAVVSTLVSSQGH